MQEAGDKVRFMGRLYQRKQNELLTTLKEKEELEVRVVFACV